MISAVLLLLMLLCESIEEGNGEKAVNEGASTSGGSNSEVSEKEKLEIKAWVEDLFKIYISDCSEIDPVSGYTVIKAPESPIYSDFDSIVEEILKYGSNSSNDQPLPNYEARKRFYDSAVKKCLVNYSLRPFYASYFPGCAFIPEQNKFDVTNDVSTTTTVITTPSVSTARSSSTKSSFGRLFNNCIS